MKLLSDASIRERPENISLALSIVVHIFGLLVWLLITNNPNPLRFATTVSAAAPPIKWLDGAVTLPPTVGSSAPSPTALTPERQAYRRGPDNRARFTPTEIPTAFTEGIDNETALPPRAGFEGLLDTESALASLEVGLTFQRGSENPGGVAFGVLSEALESSISVEPPTPPPPAPVAPKPPIRIGGQVTPAVPVKQVLPEFPRAAVQAGIEGVVILQATVGEDGKLHDIEVVSGHALLTRAAVECVRQWRYRPATLNGQIVPSPAIIRVQFTIQKTTTH